MYVQYTIVKKMEYLIDNQINFHSIKWIGIAVNTGTKIYECGAVVWVIWGTS